MSTPTEKIKNWIASNIGTTYKYNDKASGITSELELDWWNFIGILLSVILLVTVWIMLLLTIHKMDMLIRIGNRSQEECGRSYMEIETARHKLYAEYTEKLQGSLKSINTILISITGIVFLLTIANLIINLQRVRKTISYDMTDQYKTKIYLATIAFGLILGISYSTYVRKNTDIKFQTKYSDVSKKLPYASSMSTTSMLFVAFVASFALLFNVNKNLASKGYLIKQSTSQWIWIVILPVVFLLLYMMNINMTKINNNFLIPYSTDIKEINRNINSLRTLNCDNCVLQDGAKKGMKISDWTNLMLARNIKRANPEEESGDPLHLLEDTTSTGSNRYTNVLYSYLEHAMGKELQELPDNIDQTNVFRTAIRKAMRHMRHTNNDMLLPAKSFVLQIAIFTAIVVGIIAFVLFHIAYTNNPTATTISVTIACVITIAVAIGIYSWNTGRSIYV